MTQTLRFKYVEIEGKKLTVGLFRQLPIVDLCDKWGKRKETLAPFGVVRYKHDGTSLWALAMEGENVVRCALSPEQRSRKHLEEQLVFWTRHAGLPHNQSKGGDSPAHREAARYTLAVAAEPERFAAHAEVARLEQIFL